MTQCNRFGKSTSHCTEPAITAYEFWCVHEHCDLKLACVEHDEEMNDGGAWQCSYCEDHLCLATIVPVLMPAVVE